LLDGEDEMTERLLVQNAIRGLTPEQRAVLLLHYSYGFTLREIGKVLEIPVGTAASHLARGKASVATYVSYIPEIVQNDRKAISSERKSIEYWDERDANK
jgi:predicted RNA polymerase sigma factor